MSRISKNKTRVFIALVLVSIASFSQSVEELMAESDKETDTKKMATFKGTRLINGHTIESPAPGVMQLMFLHRFSPMNEGVYDLFGLDGALMRFGFDFGITKQLSVGVGRSTLQKAYDFYGKYRLFTQTTDFSMPISATLVLAASTTTQRWPPDGVTRTWEHRWSYTTQLLLASKLSERFSVQLMPTIVHRNLTFLASQDNTIYALGIGGRAKITKRMALTAEYYQVVVGTLGSGYYPSVALGLDIETGGHVFQLHITNAQGMIEPQFIGLTPFDALDGTSALRLGFNFSRVFTLMRPSAKAW